MQGDADFRAKLDSAREWEKALARWVRSSGWYVLPTYDFSGKQEDKAPKLLAPSSSIDLVMPDLQCFRNGEVHWLECKWKSQADYNRKRGWNVTGISLRLVEHYQRVMAVTGADVFLLFLHEKEGEVRGGKLHELRSAYSHDYTGPAMGRFGMRFWRWDALQKWCSLAKISAHLSQTSSCHYDEAGR